MSPDPRKPRCFGDIEVVFPPGAEGLRMSPASCMPCALKTECLRTAMGGREGWCVREEMLERAYRGGVIGFLQRWSQKKAIQRQKKDHQSS